MKRNPTTISEYIVLNENQIIRKTATGYDVIKAVKKDDKGYFIRGNRKILLEPTKIYLENFEERLKKLKAFKNES